MTNIAEGFDDDSNNPTKKSGDLDNVHHGISDDAAEEDEEPDPFLVETSKIVLDMIGLEKRTANKFTKETAILLPR